LTTKGEYDRLLHYKEGGERRGENKRLKGRKKRKKDKFVRK